MKNILTTITATVLGLALLGGFGFILAHEENSGSGSANSDGVELEDIDVDNSGPGSLNSGRDELRIEDEDEDVDVDNSGPGSLNSGRDEDEDLDEDEDVNEDMAEFRLDEDGEFRVENGVVTGIGSDMFSVSAQGVIFTVKTMTGTEFNEGTLGGLMVGDVVDEVKGTLDASNHHVLFADEVNFDED